MTTLPTIPGATRKLTEAEKNSEMVWIREEIYRALQITGEDVIFYVKWNNRFTNRLGDAKVVYGNSGRVRFSSTGLWLRATPEQRREVIYHEVAHILGVLTLKGKPGHNREWREMMRRFGYAPKRCHSINREGLRRKRQKRRTVYGVYIDGNQHGAYLSLEEAQDVADDLAEIFQTCSTIRKIQ